MPKEDSAASVFSATEFAYRNDIRFSVLFGFVDEARRRFKSEFSQKLSEEDARKIDAAERALTSLGMQMEGCFVTQPSLFDDMPGKKAVQTEWKARKIQARNGKASRSGKAPTDPLRS